MKFDIYDINGEVKVTADLSEVSAENNILRQAVIWAIKNRVSLEGANLRGVDLSYLNLECVNFSGANLADSDLNSANLEGANLSDTDLRHANLRWANLQDTDMSKAKLEGCQFDR